MWPGTNVQVRSVVSTLSNPVRCSPPGALSMGYLRQEYCSGLPFPPRGDLPDPGTKPTSPAFVGRFVTTGATWEARPGANTAAKGPRPVSLLQKLTLYTEGRQRPRKEAATPGGEEAGVTSQGTYT